MKKESNTTDKDQQYDVSNQKPGFIGEGNKIYADENGSLFIGQIPAEIKQILGDTNLQLTSIDTKKQ